jgi:hypothetical protein
VARIREPIKAARTTTGDDQRPVAGAAHETPTTATATHKTDSTATCSHGDLQALACRQTEVTADFGTATTVCDHAEKIDTSALRAKCQDLIGAGDWYREVDEASRVGEVERCGDGSRPCRGKP